MDLLPIEPLTRPLYSRNPLPGHRAEGVGQGDPGGERYIARWAREGDASGPLDVDHESPRQDPNEGLSHRWLPGGERVGREVAEQRCVT